jgi:hypothetical protein
MIVISTVFNILVYRVLFFNENHVSFFQGIFLQNVVKTMSSGKNELVTVGNDPVAKGIDPRGLEMTPNDWI